MTKIKVWLVIGLVFIAGFAGGVVANRAAVRHWVRQAIAKPERLRAIVEKRITSRLKLDADQQGKVDDILARAEGDIRDLRQEFAPPFCNITSNAVTEISAVLRPKQKERFKKLIEENQRLWPTR